MTHELHDHMLHPNISVTVDSGKLCATSYRIERAIGVILEMDHSIGGVLSLILSLKHIRSNF